MDVFTCRRQPCSPQTFLESKTLKEIDKLSPIAFFLEIIIQICLLHFIFLDILLNIRSMKHQLWIPWVSQLSFMGTDHGVLKPGLCIQHQSNNVGATVLKNKLNQKFIIFSYRWYNNRYIHLALNSLYLVFVFLIVPEKVKEEEPEIGNFIENYFQSWGKMSCSWMQFKPLQQGNSSGGAEENSCF